MRTFLELDQLVRARNRVITVVNKNVARIGKFYNDVLQKPLLLDSVILLSVLSEDNFIVIRRRIWPSCL